jgi:putative oxidoreductase
MAASGLRGWGLTILRIVVGIVFVAHGAQKIFVQGLGAVSGFLGSLGVPLPSVAAVVVAGVEFLGGLALIAGFYTRYASALLAVNMLVAIVLVHLQAGLFLPKGYEYALTLLAASLALLLDGPGRAALKR